MKRSSRRVIAASMVGTALEFYDFTLYGVFSIVIAQLFFSTQNADNSLLLSLATMAMGFLARPLGAVLFGHLGDVHGRKNALMLSIVLMAVPTFLMGLLPTYQDIGLTACFLIVGCRILQGVCADGEYNGGAIFMIEHLGKQNAGIAGALISFSGVSGCLFAMVISAFFLQEVIPQWALNLPLIGPLLPMKFPEWSWRIPFLFGGVLGLVGIYIRLQIKESPEYRKARSEKRTVKYPLKEVFAKYPKQLLICFIGGGVAGILAQTAITYMNIYVVKVTGMVLHKSLLYNSFGLLTYLLAVPLAGLMYDRLGQYKVIAWSSFLIALAAFPVFLLAKTGERGNIMLAQAILCILMSGFCAPYNGYMNRLFPTQARYSGVTMGYGLGMAVVGGSTPFVYTTLLTVTKNPYLPPLYLMIFTAIGGITILLGRHYFRDEEAQEQENSVEQKKPVTLKKVA